MIIRLSAAWRNTSLKCTQATASLSMRSRSTLPAPTDGSWSGSPTKINRDVVRTAFNSDAKSVASTIDISSTTTASKGSGLRSLRLNCKLPRSRLPKSTSSRRWIVLASRPATSESRLAARPVGAASATFMARRSNSVIMPFSVVVLPVPGPPVSIIIGWSTAEKIARRCCSA
ncbi:hypothetical protein DSECCO2_599700 [anaerobic digester metagenome]